MADRPTFTVIIPTYDRPDLLREAIASVVEQTVSDWECIVVDDCSTVPLPELDDPRVRVHRHEANGGAAVALNTGASLELTPAAGAASTMSPVVPRTVSPPPRI